MSDQLNQQQDLSKESPQVELNHLQPQVSANQSETESNVHMISEYSANNASDEKHQVLSQVPQPEEIKGAGRPELPQVPLSLLDHISALADYIVGKIEARYEPESSLQEINILINDRFDELWSFIKDEREIKLQFYKKVLKNVADKLLGEKLIERPGYLNQILRFFRNILVNFFTVDLQDESLAEIVHSLFNLDAHLYTMALQSGCAKTLLNQGTQCLQELITQGIQSITESTVNQDITLTQEQDSLLSLSQKRILNELSWRHNLKVGDRVDAIYGLTVTSHKIQHWGPATIIHITEESPQDSQPSMYNYYDGGNNQMAVDQPGFSSKRIRVQFDGIPDGDNKKYFPLYSIDIAAPGTFTDDFEWRYDLKENDFIECVDQEAVWYKSTVFDTRETKEDPDSKEPPLKEAYVGYRYYDDEEGHKIDEKDGRKFVGWSFRYDIWIPVTSPQIQRLGTVARSYKVAGKNSMIYDTTIIDESDVMANNSKRKVWAISRSNFFQNLRHIADFVNEFGARGGFEKILDLFNGKLNIPITLRHISFIMDFIQKVDPLFLRNFTVQFTPKIKDAFIKVMLGGVLQLKFNREHLISAQKSFVNILKRHYPSSSSGHQLKFLDDNYHLIESDLSFQIACNLLKSEKLEQRVTGLNQVNEQIKPKFTAYRKGLSEKDMLQRLREQNVIEVIFGEKDSHVQLVQRGLELIKFLVDQKDFTEQDLELVWSAAQRGEEQTKLEILKIFKDIQYKFRNEEIERIVRLFAERIEPTKLIFQELDCVSSLIAYGQKGTNAAQIAADFFWDIGLQNRSFPKELVETAIDKLINLVKGQDREVKMKFIDKAYLSLTEGKASIQCVRIMAKLIEDIPNYKAGTLPSAYEVVSELIKTYGIINLVIIDLEKYSLQVNSQWDKGQLKKENIDTVDINGLPFSHRSNIANRLTFIRMLLHLSINFISMDELNKIWDILVTKSHIPNDQQYFFEWFQGLLSEGARVPYDLIEDFFETKICARCYQPGSFSLITRAGFECIQSMFLQVNEHAERLQIVSLPNSNNSTKLEFNVTSVPSELHGVDVLWKILQECDKKNVDLTTDVVHLITRLYHNLSGVNPKQIQQIQEQFCKECLNQLKAVTNPSPGSTATDEEKKQFVKTVIQMFRSFLYEAEKNGTGALRYHQGLNRGEYLEKVILQNLVSQVKSTARLVEVNVYSNMTVWELKKLASQKFNVSPLCIELKRNNTHKKLISDINNHLLLRDINIENYEILQVMKKSIVSHARVKLLNKKKELIPEAKAIFQSWFESFSTDGLMNATQCGLFIKATTNTPEPEVLPTDNRIVTFFQEYGISNFGYLTEEEFLKFYRDKAESKPEAVWNNLTHLNYGGNLKHLSESNNPNDPRENQDYKKLPRAMLTSDQQTFKEMFDLIEKLPSGSQEEMWPLICQLRTNPVIYGDLLTVKNLEKLSLQESLIFEVLYQLQIVDSIINQYQNLKPCEIKSYYSEIAVVQNEYPNLSDAYQEEEKSNIRDIQAVAPESGKAIPLPPPSTVPEPPKTNVPFIGPLAPSNYNSSSNNAVVGADDQKKKVQDLVGIFRPDQIVTEPWIPVIFSDDELGIESQNKILSTWVQSFVFADGFKTLTQLFEQLYNRTQGNKGIKTKGERDCWNTLLRILKVLLTSAFVNNVDTPELTLALTRRMSSTFDAKEITSPPKNSEENNTSDKKNQVMEDHENTMKLFAPLIEIMTGHIGSKVLEQIDFKKLQDMILSIVQLMVKKKDLSFDERQVIDQAMQLWISAVIFNQSLIQVIFDDWETQQQLSSSQQQHQMINTQSNSITKILIEDGLLSSNYGVRQQFRDQLKFLAESVKSRTLTQQPFMFFLRVLLLSNDITLKKPKEAAQYYQLLTTLLTQYLQARKSGEVMGTEFDLAEIVAHYIRKLVEYQSQEEKGKYLGEDHNLGGFLKIIQELIQSEPLILTEQDQQSLAEEIINRCLFTFEIKPLEVHITKDVDIAAAEKSQLNKSQSVNSRRGAFNLLQTLCNNNPELITHLISTFFNPLLKQIKKPKKAGYQPRTETRSFGFCGLRNLGCICYMNSMIQQFFCVPTFRYSLMSAEAEQEENMQEFEGELVNDNMLHQFMKLISFLELSERQDYNPREFCFAFKDHTGKAPTNVRIQQDSQEFLGVAFDRLEHALAKTTKKYLVQNIFGGTTCSVMICKGCGNVRESSEHFYNLTLEVKNQKSIFDGLKRLTTGETIQDYRCEACNNKVDVDRKMVVEKLPNILILHLQRIVFDMDTFMNSKLNTRVEFPNTLNMRPYMKDEILKQDKEAIDKARRNQMRAKRRASSSTIAQVNQNEDGKEEEEDVNMKMQQIEEREEDSSNEEIQDQEMNEEQKIPDEEFQYKLVGVVLHMGTADAGHYLSYININRGVKDEESPEWLQTEKDKWLEFNDSQVRMYNFNNLETDCFGGGNPNQVAGEAMFDYSKNAYMLVYEKRRKEPIKFVIPEQVISSMQSETIMNLDCDGTATSRQSNEVNLNADLIHKICPEVRKDKLGSLKVSYDENSKEHYTLVDFNAIEKFVPNSLYRLVNKDNHNFLFERQIFNPGYFEAIKGMLQTLIEKSPESIMIDSEESRDLFQFVEKLLFDILAMTSDNKLLIDITQQFTKMLELNEGQALRFIDSRILLKQKEAKDQKEFFENLVSHMDKDVREMHAILLKACVNICFSIGNTEILDQLMNNALSLIPDDLTKNWLKIYQFLWFLYEVTRSGRAQLLYMMEKKLIMRLIDFFLENDSPFINGVVSKNKKRQVMGSNYANPPLDQLILNISYILRKQPYINLSGREVPMYNGVPLRSVYCLLEKDEEPYPTLSNEEMFMLKQKPFFVKLMKCHQEVYEYSRLLSHIAFNNLEVSRTICKKALVGLNKASADETFNFITVIVNLLSTYDLNMYARFEWILGVPQIKLDRPYYNQQNYQFGLKIGVECLNQINDDYFEYKSTLFKSSSQVKESYLQLLYQYRKRWPKYVLDSMIALFQACFTDSSGLLYQYIYTMEPPTTQYARFLDWIRPYLADTIESCLRNPTLQSNQQELSLAMQANNLFDQLQERYPFSGELKAQANAFLEQRQPGNQKNPKRLFQYDPAKDGGSQSYLVWQLTKETILEQDTHYDDKITYQVREFEARITESMPNGETNLAFPSNKFYSYNNFNQVGSADSGHRTVQFNNVGSAGSQNWGQGKRQFGRGKAMYKVKQTTSGHIVHTRRGTGSKRPKKNINKDVGMQFEQGDIPNNNQNDDESYNTDEAEGGADSDEHLEENFMDVEKVDQKWDNGTEPIVSIPSNSPNEQSAHDAVSSQTPHFSQNGPAVLLDRVNGNGEQTNPGGEVEDPANFQSFNNQVSDLEANNLNSNANTQEANFSSTSAVPVVSGSSAPLPGEQLDEPKIQESNQDEDAKMIDEGEHSANDADADQQVWEANLPSIIVFTVTNLDKLKSQKVNLRFFHLNQEKPFNERIPFTPMQFTVMPGKDRDCFVVTKLSPFDDWGNFRWEITVGDDPSEQERQAELIPIIIEPPQEEIVVEEPIQLPKDEEFDTPSDKLQCPVCTYHNDLHMTQCEICGSNLA